MFSRATLRSRVALPRVWLQAQQPVRQEISVMPYHTSSTVLQPIVTINVPSMGDSISEGTVVEWLKKVDDVVAEDEDVAIIETDKVSVNIKAPQAGRISVLLHEVDDTVEVNKPLYELDTDAVAASTGQTPASSDAPAPAATTTTSAAATTTNSPSAEPVSVNVPQLGDSVTEGTYT
jgi:2-oxoglutarate dehydrogenase E2 component (dihydrolipoamide succinyltransferase)